MLAQDLQVGGVACGEKRRGREIAEVWAREGEGAGPAGGAGWRV